MVVVMVVVRVNVVTFHRVAVAPDTGGEFPLNAGHLLLYRLLLLPIVYVVVVAALLMYLTLVSVGRLLLGNGFQHEAVATFIQHL